MKIVQYKYFTFLLHALVWSVVLFFPYFISGAGNGYSIGPLPGFYFTLSGIVHIGIFYVNAFYLYPKFLNRAYWWLYIIIVVLLIFVSVKLKSAILDQWFPQALPDARTHVLFPSVLVFIVSVFYGITKDKIHAEKLKKDNESTKLTMELKLLRSQISPHFLFNILTNLVSLARKKSDKMEASLLMLSDLMRYMLHDAGKKISLRQEVEYLESYIALQKMRFGENVNIVSNIELRDNAIDHDIEPMLLIPFIENAFKHGTSHINDPFITIDLVVDGGVLDFRVKNRSDQQKNAGKDDNSGIGLDNVRSRLALLYPNMHELTIQSGEKLFSIHLTMKLAA